MSDLNRDEPIGAIVFGDHGRGLRALGSSAELALADPAERTCAIVPVELVEQARDHARAARAERTRDAYRY